MDSTQLELPRLESVEWSTAYLPLSKLLDKYPLPQIVKIIEGFYGERNDSTLCNNAILYLHSVKTIQKVHGHFSFDKSKEISIPLDCQSKVEVRPSNMKEVYESVQELCSVFPKYVRVSQGKYSFFINCRMEKIMKCKLHDGSNQDISSYNVATHRLPCPNVTCMIFRPGFTHEFC